MVEVRIAVPEDTEFLWEMVYWAAHVDEDDGVTLADVRANPDLVGHVADFGRHGDIGVVAEIAGRRVGAAWVRLLVPGVSDFSVFVDETTPELVVAVAPDHVGTGVGGALLRSLFDHADHHVDQIVLSVRADNPAVRLYERHGFREIGRITNRVGTESLQMVRSARAT